MLLQQRWIKGQQLSQTQQGIIFHIGIVMVELRHQVLVKGARKEKMLSQTEATSSEQKVITLNHRGLTLIPSCLCVVGPLVSLFSCSDRWIPFVRKLVLVALSALGFFFPTFNFTFWKSSCLFFFLAFISTLYTAVCITSHTGEMKTQHKIIHYSILKKHIVLCLDNSDVQFKPSYIQTYQLEPNAVLMNNISHISEAN